MGGGGSKSKQKVAPAAESLPAAAASSVPAVDPAASPAPAPPSQLPPPEAHQPSPAPSETTPAPSPDIRAASLSPLQTDQSIFGDDANYPTHDEEEGGNDFVAMQTSPTIADGIAAIDESAAAVHDTTIVDTGDDARSDDGEGLTAVPVPLQHPGPTTPATASPEPEGEGDDAAVAINSHLALSVGDLKIGSDETTDTGGSAGGNGNGYANGDLVGTKVGIFPPQDDGSADGDGGNNTSGDSVPGSRPTAAVEDDADNMIFEDDFSPMESGGEFFDGDGGSRAGSASHGPTPEEFSFEVGGYDDSGGTYDDDLSTGSGDLTPEPTDGGFSAADQV